MSAVVALYDACVLFPASLRDLLVWLSIAGACRARWTDTIHDEWIRGVLANRPGVSPASLARCRQLMDENVPDSLITGYEHLIPAIELPDVDDCHVLAAAIHGRADCIVTFNLKDFPTSALAEYEIEAVHPDDFVMRLLDAVPESVGFAVRSQRGLLKSPPKTVDEHLATLASVGLAQTAMRLRTFAESL